jgi:bifunctional non-homologous end joining protein LigD
VLNEQPAPGASFESSRRNVPSEIVERAIIRFARRRDNDKNVKANVQKAPSFIEPMKALPVEKLPEGDWLYEIKFDRYRALAFKDGKDVRLSSRNKKAFDYPQLLGALTKVVAGRMLHSRRRNCCAR